jgi:[ribosomal protein S5]-alanine N-acetyltransferase
MTLAHATDRIESERLWLRRIVPGDLDFFTRIHADPEVARYIGHGRPRSPEESQAWLQWTLASYEEATLGHLAVLRKTDGMLIGRCGLSELAVEAEAPPASIPRVWFGRAQAPPDTALTFEAELGYSFERSSWGHGYASEAARCVHDHARNVLRLSRMVSLIHPDNIRSLGVVQKFGVRHERAANLLGRTFDIYVWPDASSPASSLP